MAVKVPVEPAHRAVGPATEITGSEYVYSETVEVAVQPLRELVPVTVKIEDTGAVTVATALLLPFVHV